MSYVLDDIKVLDLTRVLAGPWATQVLADFGAEVIKIESPDGGDEARRIPPFFGSGDDEESGKISSFFACCNRGKHSVQVDLTSEKGKALVRELAGECDVLVENFKVGNLARFGLDYASLADANPRLIYCSITGYGQTGPMASYPGYDLLFQGMSGSMSTCGLPDGVPGGGPMRTIIPYTDVMSGMYACNAILLALMDRARTGKGQHIDIALLDVAIAANAYVGSRYLATGESLQRIGNSGVAASPSGVYRCNDGWVIVQCNPNNWPKFCDVVGRPEWASDPRFIDLGTRLSNASELDDLVSALFADQSKAQVVARIAPAGVPCVPVNSIGEAFEEEQVRHRGLVQEQVLADGQTVRTVRNPMRFSRTRLRDAPPPLLGEHNIPARNR